MNEWDTSSGGHETLLKVKGDIDDVSNELDNGGDTRFPNLVDSFFPLIKTQPESLPKPDEIGKLLEEVVDLSMKINSEVANVQELLDSPNQKQTTDELIEIHELFEPIQDKAWRETHEKIPDNPEQHAVAVF
ncbi:hypothetical protein TNCV_2719491 [Trichonephila clavipes]|nr:hypothetical protein TNCV_2719491 [Trichonephila clavipes]